MRHYPPYNKTYIMNIDGEFAGLRLIDLYTLRFPFFSREQWLEVIASGAAWVNDIVADSEQILQSGDVLKTERRGVVEPPVNDAIEILCDENGLLVLNKPAPLPVHPSGRYFKNTLVEILAERNPDKKFHPIYRLDAWTTGVIILATEDEAARILHRQVLKRRMRKFYAVLAKSINHEGSFVVDAPIGRVMGGIRGVGENTIKPKPAQTIFTVLAKNADVCLLRAELLTGRTNQIRVHLAHMGGHVLNDPLYGPEGKKNQDDLPYLGLHCREMHFEFPFGNPRVARAPWPEHFKKYFSSEEMDALFE